jgi:hypothetical protein
VLDSKLIVVFIIEREQIIKKAVPDELFGGIIHSQPLSPDKNSVAKPPVICQGGFLVEIFCYALLSFFLSKPLTYTSILFFASS